MNVRCLFIFFYIIKLVLIEDVARNIASFIEEEEEVEIENDDDIIFISEGIFLF